MGADQERRAPLVELAKQHATAAIDLSALCLDLSELDILPSDIAEQHGILPLLAAEDTLFLAMVAPGDRKVVEEIEFVTGKTVVAYVALETPLRRIIKHVYSVKARGAQFFTGPNCPPEQTQVEGPDRLTPCLVHATAELEPPPDSFDRLPSLIPRGVDDSSRYILVVDDDQAIRKLLVRLLQAEGHEVREADDGAAALEVLRGQMPKLLVTDAELPRVHGFELVRRLRASTRYASLPIIIVSAIYRGWRFADDMRESCGVRQFVEKPFTRETLLAAVKAELGEGQAVAAEATQAPYDRASRAYEAGRFDDAIQYLEQGLEQFPDTANMRVQLALLYAKKGLIYEAISALERAVQADGTHFLGIRNLAIFYQQAGFRNKATEMWMRALNLAPEEATRESIKNHLISMI